MADYQEHVVDLTAALERKPLAGVGQPIDSVYLNGALPPGLIFRIHFGDRAGIIVRDFASIEICPAESQGVFVSSSPPAPGQTISVILGTGLSVEGRQ